MLLTATLLLPLASTPTTTVPPVPLTVAPSPGQDDNTAKESETGHRYPVWNRSLVRKADEGKPAGKPKIIDLLGMAVREKTILAVNVYSYALYVEREFVDEDLAPWKGKKSKVIEKDAAIFTKLLAPNATKELHMRFCRNVDAEDVVSAFEDSLEPRILARRKNATGSKADKLKELTEFRGFFDLDKLKKGNELRFTWHPDGTLSTVVNGVRKPDIVSKDLSWALFDVYLGEKPISKSGKKRLLRRLPTVLSD